jgi:hypothetical protein
MFKRGHADKALYRKVTFWSFELVPPADRDLILKERL